jgi:opacity protein-like surface antigen
LIDNSNQAKPPQDYLVTAYLIQPKVFTELTIPFVEKLHPFIGLGYTFVSLQLSGSNNGVDVSEESDTLSGLGFNVGLAYDISKKVFVQAQYDFTKLNVDNIPDVKYNTNVNLLKLGIGFRF